MFALLRGATLVVVGAVVLSGCFLRSIVGYVDDDGGATLSGNVQVSFCDFGSAIPEFWGCNYTVRGLSGSPIEITSTFELVSEFGVFGLIVDPVIFQVPADASNVVATYNNAGSDEPAIVTETTSFPVTPGVTVESEPGTKFLILELPDVVLAAIPPGGADFDFTLDFDVADFANLVVKPMFTARVDEGGTRYYVPIFPCVTDFAQIPPVPIPVGGFFQDLRPGLGDLIADADELACDQVVYDFTAGPPSASTARYVPVVPTRVHDTRAATALQADETRNFQITGGPIPATATAVLLNVTATETNGTGWVQAFPTGQAAVGSSSTLNLDVAGQTIPNSAFVAIGDGGMVSVYSTFETDIVIDAFGYFVPAATSTSGRLVGMEPTRILDTRSGIGQAASPSPAIATPVERAVDGGSVLTLQVAGAGGVPSSGVSAVVMNVTVDAPTAQGFVQIGPTPVSKGAHSNLNTEPGRTIANLVVVPPGAGGTVDFFVELYQPGTVELLADVVGYFTDATAPDSAEGLFVPITPTRITDTREPGPNQPEVPSGSTLEIDATAVAPGSAVLAGNLTSNGGDPGGYLQLGPQPITPGASSNLNTSYAGQTIANAVVSAVAAGEQAEVYTFGSTHILLDITGWFTS